MIDLILAPQRTVNGEKSKGEKNVVGDRPYISLFKTISWRIVGTVDTITISYIITGNIGNALSIGGFEIFSKMVLYYLHERAWNRARSR